MKSLKLLIPVVLVMLMLMTACATPAAVTPSQPANNSTEAAQPTEAPQPAGFTVTDGMGRTVTFEKAPSRIVLVGKSLFMVADAIYLFPEAGKNIIAIGATNQGSGNFIPLIDETYASKTVLDSNASVEDIAALQPDLVITKSLNAETYGTPLEQLGIPVVYLDFETAEQYQRDLATLGQIFNNPAKAEELAAWFQGKVEAVSGVVAGLSEEQKPKTLLIYYSEKEGAISFNVPPASWMQTFLVESAGGTPVWIEANPGKGWATVNIEQIAAWNPDVVLIVSYFKPVNEVVDLLKADEQWKLLDAVKNNKIFGFPTDAYSWDQPDPRWALGLQWAATKLHPDLFTDLDILAEAKAFYLDLYDMDDAAFAEKIEPTLIGDVK
jgi:iron complex transport system substrate-binding protein